MPPIYVKPENALRRAEELLALGTSLSKAQAFEFLSEVFQSKRFKQTPIPTLEPIVLKYLDLCVDLQRKSDAREALLQYKNAAQNTNVTSVEKVLEHFISSAETRLSAAIEQAKTEVAALPPAPATKEEEDDDLPLQPTAMLFDSFIDSAGDRERIERRLINPAQKFCWDAYDVSLDIAKGNDRLEIIYQSIARRAFKFCVEHERKGDFRRLCEQRLRKDLANATKYGHQMHAVNLADPETLSRHLDTRFLQLETALKLELWQEAFRSVEDVHGLVAGGKKIAKPSMMANYYESLTQIFNAEGGKQTAVFHAAAWARYFFFAERAGNVSPNASVSVLLSALAVPLGDVESKQRLIALLNLPKMPTRASLVSDAAAKHLKRVSPEIRQLYHIIEVDFQPLKACKQLAPLVAAVPDNFAAYLPALHDVVLSRLVQGLSRVYDTVSLDHILNLVKPFDNGPWATDMPALEKFLMTAAHRGDINATIDHVAKTINFASPPSDLNRLATLALCLYNTVQYLTPSPPTSRADAFAAAIAQAEAERKQSEQRRLVVARRRELMEEANLRREREESTAKAERAKQLAEDQARAAREAEKQAEIDRLQRQIDATRREEALKYAEQIAAKSGVKVDISTIKDEDLDTNKVVELSVEIMNKEKRELNERLRIIAKRVDHLERAFRKEERPLLAADYDRQKEDDRTSHDRAQVLAREQAIAQQKHAVELKQRLQRMMPDYLEARSGVEAQRQSEFEAARLAAAKKIAEEKEKFKAQVIARRKAEKAKRDREAALEEQRLREEEERAAELAREEEERAEAEARAAAEIEARNAEAAARAAALRAEREEQRKKDAELLRLRQEREEEAERRRAERTGSGPGARRPATAAAASPAAGEGGAPVAPTAVKPGGWRERAAAQAAGGAAPSPASPSPAAAAAAAPGSSAPAPTAVKPGGWRERAAAANAGGASPSGASTPPTANGNASPAAPASPAAEGERVQSGGGTWRRGSGARGGMTRGGAPSGRGAPGAAGGAGGSRW